MAKQDMRNSLIKDIESELQKNVEDIDPGFIDRRVDELYALDGLTPPTRNDEALDAAARTIRARAAWRCRNTQANEARKHRFTRRAVRGAVAVCCAFLFLFSANYLTTLLTGSCLPSKVGIKVCCGTQFCHCEIAKADEENPVYPE
ncbi:MAG: hypothetical protein LBG27_03080 [Spirochaetaceae bacterium]|jgi:VIT1/CCC1 family predicted Fe2+/Mn2+ transporter|nr:hypothetical protein [Spirochaetaceae bacterium]